MRQRTTREEADHDHGSERTSAHRRLLVPRWQLDLAKLDRRLCHDRRHRDHWGLQYGSLQRRHRRRRCGYRPHHLIQLGSQPRDILFPPGVTQLERVAPRQLAHVLGQLGRPQHLRTTHQHGNHPESGALEPAHDFQPHEITRIVETTLADAPSPRPSLAHDHEEHRAPADRIVHDLDEILPRADVIDVHEDPLRPEARTERVVQATDVPGAVITPVAQENHRRSRRVKRHRVLRSYDLSCDLSYRLSYQRGRLEPREYPPVQHFVPHRLRGILRDVAERFERQWRALDGLDQRFELLGHLLGA